MIDIDYKIKRYVTILKDTRYHVYFKHKEDWKWTRIFDNEFSSYKEALGYVTRLQNGEPEPPTSRPIYWSIPKSYTNATVTVTRGGGSGGAHQDSLSSQIDTLKKENHSLSVTIQYQADIIKDLRNQILELKKK